MRVSEPEQVAGSGALLRNSRDDAAQVRAAVARPAAPVHCLSNMTLLASRKSLRFLQHPHLPVAVVL